MAENVKGDAVTTELDLPLQKKKKQSSSILYCKYIFDVLERMTKLLGPVVRKPINLI